MTVDSQRARTMSGKELRIKLFDLMKTKGILDDVKSNLRKNLIDELRGVNQFRPTDVSNPSLLVRVVNTLIVEHLKICDYDYTLSVFIPEAQLNDYKSISNDEIFKLLNISKESHFYKKIESQLSNTENKNSLLLNFISSISFYLPESTQSTSCQTTYDLWTGSVAGNTLDEKLSTLDLMYDSRQQDESKHVTTEEKLLLFQKRIEQKLQDEFKQQIEQFRVNEIKKIHEEERLKCQMELQSLKKELEHAYQSKHETLSEKETRISERFKTELENEKRDLYGQRQTFLDELKSMKLRETDFQRDLQLRERQVTCYNMIPAITLEADRIKRLETDMSKRELTLQNTELYIDQQVQAKLSKLRFEIEQQLMERNKSLQILEIRNQEESKRLAEERLICEQSKMELIQYKKQLSQVDSMDYMSIREENAILKSKMDENLTNRSQKSHIHRYNNESGSDDTPRKLDSHILSDQLKKVFDSQLVEHRVMNEELVDLKTQIALLQTQEGMGKMNENLLLKSKNIDYLSHVLVQSEDVQDYYPSTLSSNYNQFIDDAKLRMLELDKEADRVEEYFRDYQHRTLNKVNYVQQSDGKHKILIENFICS
ncbi:unnamed protein product [Didymodactylos carnosus]|uniref:LisH domain-containing protein n=2 Tax=Didymodactylos carnosus TaxID=1234261 RepID=A0A814AV82_9BILA|nr:unnamed protein product [Didymodactylos carnosus]CAF3699752.1 unnamed protein product [Didymodactylos carnosus]